MIKNFIFSVIGISFLSTACEMLIPEGKMKKYYKLVTGFIMMCVLINPISNITTFEKFEFSFSESITEEELLAESEAYILQMHKENIEKRIKEICGEETQAFIELYADGLVKSVVLKGNVTMEKLVLLKEELGCDDIKVSSGVSDEN